MVIDPVNMGDYMKETDNMTIEWERLNIEVTGCLLLAPKEIPPIRIETPQKTDKEKIRTILKPETLINDAAPVEFRIWTKEFSLFPNFKLRERGQNRAATSAHQTHQFRFGCKIKREN